MKNIMIPSASRNASLYATGPILSSTSNESQYLGDNLAQLPSFKELFFAEVNMIPYTELSVHSMFIYIAFLSVLCCFQILSDLYNLLLHLLEQSIPSTIVHWIIPSH